MVAHPFTNWSTARPLTTFLLTVTCLWCLAEVLFWFYFVATRRRLQTRRRPTQTLLSQAERSKLFWNCLHTLDDIESWCVGWYYYAHSGKHPAFNEICRENIALWFAWAFWHDHLDNVRKDKAWADELEQMIDLTEQWYNVHFPKGYNADLQCIRLDLDPVQAVHRPLVFYLAVYWLTMMFNSLMMEREWGFVRGGSQVPDVLWGGILGFVDRYVMHLRSTKLQKDKHKHMVYWYRRSHNSTAEKMPIVFIHGIGAGLMSYLGFLRGLVETDRPIFCVELPYVSMRMVEHVPTAQETVDEIEIMLETHGFKRAVIVSHSLGTAVTSWIMMRRPKLVAGVVLIDPICFLLHHHHVGFNFVHRIPSTWFEYLLFYGASRELHISHYISRHFQWFQTIFFVNPSSSKERPRLPCAMTTTGPMSNATVFLSEEDGIVDGLQVAEYLHGCGVDARVMPRMKHAGFLLHHEWRQKIVDQVEVIARKADGLAREPSEN